MAINLGIGTIRNLNKTTNNLKDLFDRVSSGKISGKDLSGALGVAKSLESDAAVNRVAQRNIQDGRSLIAVGDNALEQKSNIDQRRLELATQSANGTLSDSQRQALAAEDQALKEESERIIATTQFNGRSPFEATSIETGGDVVQVSGSKSAVPATDISTQAGAQAAIDSLKAALKDNASDRASFGGSEVRLDVREQNNAVKIENFEAARSRIEDADIADSSSKITRDITRRYSQSEVLKVYNDIQNTALELLKK